MSKLGIILSVSVILQVSAAHAQHLWIHQPGNATPVQKILNCPPGQKSCGCFTQVVCCNNNQECHCENGIASCR